MPAGVRHCLAALVLALAACDRDEERGVLLGTLEWDRIELVAEASEPVLEIAVHEGDAVTSGQVLVRLDPRRAELELELARAEHSRLLALREEQQHGARPEAIAEAEARTRQARSRDRNARQELTRIAQLRERKLIAQADLDRATTTQQGTAAEVAAAQAALDLVLAGTRSEQLAQTEAQIAAASGRIASAELNVDRLGVEAPRAGRVDAIPVEVGDQPPRGGTLISLLVGSQPYARVYVPARERAALAERARFSVEVEGIAQSFPARLRYVQRDPGFTPFYALTGDDASRLVYLAELELEGDAARGLPAGLPVRARAAGTAAPARNP